MKRRRLVRDQIRQIESTRLDRIEQAPSEGAHAMVRLLARVMGIGIETADMLVQEVLSRNLRDRRAVARAGLHGLSRRNREWVRRFGASQPMRMTASWFGSLDPPNTRLWRDWYAHSNAGSPLIVIPTPLSGPPCSELSRYGPASAERVERLVRRPTLTAPARAGFAILRVGTKKQAFRSNKETDQERKKVRRSETA